MEENKNIQSDLSAEELQSLTSEIADMTEKTTNRNMMIPKRPHANPANRNYNRRARRQVQKMFDKQQKKRFPSTNLDFKGWMAKVAQNQANGKQLHNRHVKAQWEMLEESLQAKERDIRYSLEERGMKQAAIDAYIENWYDGLKLWNEEAV